MKRLIPLWITALGGFALIVAYFIPATQDWGEVAAIWFDILAAIAFILGGGTSSRSTSRRRPTGARGGATPSSSSCRSCSCWASACSR